MLKLMDKELITIFAESFCLTGPMQGCWLIVPFTSLIPGLISSLMQNINPDRTAPKAV